MQLGRTTTFRSFYALTEAKLPQKMQTIFLVVSIDPLPVDHVIEQFLMLLRFVITSHDV